MATIYLLTNPELLLHPSRLLNPKPEDRKQIEKICAFLSNTEGRDKIAKLFQFFARFLDGFLRTGPGQQIFGPSIHPFCDQLKALWSNLQTSRGWSWMGKSMVEWKTDIITYENQTLSNEIKLLHMTCRFFFAVRWFFENFMLLTSSKFLIEKSKGGFMPLVSDMNRWAKKSWFLALVFGVLTECAKLRLIFRKKKEIEDQFSTSQITRQEYVQHQNEQSTDLRLRLRTVAMMVLDSPVTLSVGLGYSDSFGNMSIGLSHGLAAWLQCQNLWPK